jgi:hypothetical protein
MEITPHLVRRLKRLRLGGLLPTLPDRAAHARQGKLNPLELLELLLQDEIKLGIGPNSACSECSGCRKQRTTAGPQGWWKGFENPLGEGFGK